MLFPTPRCFSWRPQDSDTSVAARCLHSLECPADCYHNVSLMLHSFSITFSKVSSLYCIIEQSIQGITPVFFRKAVVNLV